MHMMNQAASVALTIDTTDLFEAHGEALKDWVEGEGEDGEEVPDRTAALAQQEVGVVLLALGLLDKQWTNIFFNFL